LQLSFKKAREAASALSLIEAEKINEIITDLADAAVAQAPFLLEANGKDLAKMQKEAQGYDRLQLTKERINAIASELRQVASLPNPLGEVLEKRQLPNGLSLSKVRVPLGVVGVIYEARPNVTFDVFALCFKTGNAVTLKGGSDAQHSNEAIVRLIHTVLEKHQVNKNIVTLLPPEREAATALLNAVGFVDVLIPRGSQGLIDFVRQNSRVPVIETGAGIVHTYADASADPSMLKEIVLNAKTRRVSVCNALDCLILHRDLLASLPGIVAPLAERSVVLYADEPSFAQLENVYPENLIFQAQEEHFGTEFLSLKMALRTVDNFEQAIEHIAKFSSKHSEAIISSDPENIETFLRRVDAAVVYANASTAFTDGAQFGLGAEIGISTQKLHARGPMGLKELTSYKWVVRGTGQVRPA
ncbi:MAG: glutamate-5-semialdehyde dehydrogenase, partial [Flavisolibacter sp.]